MIREWGNSLLHIFFPHNCEGCGNESIGRDTFLCLECLSELPVTGFSAISPNPVEKLFYGRTDISCATAAFYFSRNSLLQKLTHELKYKSNRAIGIFLGQLMGQQLTASKRFYPDVLVPVPLYPDKEKTRGYNQSTLLCEGIQQYIQVPVVSNAIIRPAFTESQTKKGRMERWKNIEGKFVLNDPRLLQNKKILLVDDVLTTGATLESCGNELLKSRGASLGIACLGYSSR